MCFQEGSDYISSGSELAGEGEMPISDDEEEETDSENYDDKDDSDDIDF